MVTFYIKDRLCFALTLGLLFASASVWADGGAYEFESLEIDNPVTMPLSVGHYGACSPLGTGYSDQVKQKFVRIVDIPEYLDEGSCVKGVLDTLQKAFSDAAFQKEKTKVKADPSFSKISADMMLSFCDSRFGRSRQTCDSFVFQLAINVKSKNGSGQAVIALNNSITPDALSKIMHQAQNQSIDMGILSQIKQISEQIKNLNKIIAVDKAAGIVDTPGVVSDRKAAYIKEFQALEAQHELLSGSPR